MTDKYLNIVTCGMCGKIFGHIPEHEGDLQCPYCTFKDDKCHFPDLHYPPQHADSYIRICGDGICNN